VLDKPQVFALTTTQAATCPGSIEDVCSIANSGEVPNLFSQDDIEEIRAEIAKQARLAGDIDMLSLFAERCRANVHVLLSISPAGSDLREHLRRYPALGNCTTIDWFLPWPEEGLRSVAVSQLAKTDCFKEPVPSSVSEVAEKEPSETSRQLVGQRTVPESPTLVSDIASLVVQIHNSVVEAAETYQREHSRAVYLTPARCSEALVMFERLLVEKSDYLRRERNQYVAGVSKLEEANQNIDSLQEELERLGPELEAKGAAVEAGMVVLEREAKEVEETQRAVGEEAALVAEQKAEAEAIKRECELRLAEAQPQYEAALLALRTLKVADFVTMKSFLQPPQPIRLALEAACIMLGHKPKMVDKEVGKGGQKVKVPDYWDRSRKLLNDYKKFLLSLEKYDKDNIPAERIEGIQKYLHNPEFVPEKIRKASEAAEGICKWVIAVCKYDIIAKEVRPRRAALQEAEAKLSVAEAEFAQKEQELNEVLARRGALEAEHARSMAERQGLIA
jgi:dynein heavy chain